MRRSKLETQEYLGRFASIFNVGDTQDMVFQHGDTGPFNLSIVDKEATKLDRPTGGTVTKKRKKEDLERELRAKGVRGKGTREALLKLCRENDIYLWMSLYNN